MSNGGYRCKRCRYDFGEFTGRWLSLTRLSAKQRVWLIKLFSLEISTRKIAKDLEISYATALKAVDAIRKSIIMHGTDDLLKGKIEMDEAYFGGSRKGSRGRGAGGKVPVLWPRDFVSRTYV